MAATLRAGDRVWVTAPLGTGLSKARLKTQKRILFMSGGVGGASVLPLARARRELGFTHDVWVHGERDAESLDRELLEDSARPQYVYYEKSRPADGLDGRITQFLSNSLGQPLESFSQAIACGPSGMLEALSRDFAAHSELAKTELILGLEEKMGCGVGLCFSCSVLSVEGPKRCCLEGPWFEARSIPEHFKFRKGLT
jgi:dihydroorotate dehydrogenase electron transfer subunit